MASPARRASSSPARSSGSLDTLRDSAQAVVVENGALITENNELRAKAVEEAKAVRVSSRTQKREIDHLKKELAGRVSEATALTKEKVALTKENDALRAKHPLVKLTSDFAAMGLTTAALVFTAAEGSLLTFKGFMSCLPAIALALNSVEQAKLVPLVVLVIMVAAMSLTQSAFVTVNVEEATQGTMKTCAEMLTKLAEAQCSREKLGSSLGCIVTANLGQHIPCNATLRAPQATSCDPQKPTACASGAGLALQNLGLDKTTFFTADQAAQIFQHADELLKKKLV